MSSFIEDELGELLRHDAAHGTDLTRTLWTYLVSGASKTEIARSLHLRRQSLYQRLAKIEQLVGGIEDPGQRVALILASKAHRLVRHCRRPHRRIPPRVRHPAGFDRRPAEG